MALVTFDIPDLNRTGSQPATDIVNALDAIKTEVNGNLDAANLATGGVREQNIDPQYDYSETSRFVSTSSLAFIKTFDTTDADLVEFSVELTAHTSFGSGTLALYVFGSAVNIILDAAPTSTTPRTYYSSPGATAAYGGSYAQSSLVFTVDGYSSMSLYAYAASANVTVTDLSVRVNSLKDF